MAEDERSPIDPDEIDGQLAAEIAEEFDEVEDQLYTDDAEDATALEESDDPALVRFDKSQRDLVTSVVDYNLGSLSELVNKEKIDLAPRYQRRYRWDAKRQSKLIESFLMNVPIPPIFLNEDRYGTYAVIDGKQRIFAVREFIRGRLKLRGLEVFEEVNGKTIDTMPSRLRDILETRATIRAIIILPQSQPAVKFEVFKRLNTGGVRLNPQEIRNSSYPGPLNNLILDLSVKPEFHDLLSIRDKDRSAIYREMRDAEFVLRFFTFRETWDSFSGGMMRHMDEFMLDNQQVEGRPLAMFREDFEQTLVAVEAAFGDHAFQRWIPTKDSWRQQVLASLFDAEMFAARGKDPERLRESRGEIEAKLKEMFSDAEFREAIDAATNTPVLFKRRISMMSQMLEAVVSA
jgi:Protein of unknown function DUF262